MNLALLQDPAYLHAMIESMPTRFRLDELLLAARLSQSELSRRSGVSLVTINSMANNKTTRVDLATLNALSVALECDPGDLIEREPEKKRR